MKRQNAMCPNCLSLERHRLLIHYLRHSTNLFRDSVKVLHLAPERILFKILNQQEQLEYIPADLFPEKYPKGTVKVDVTDIPFEENYFNVILCNHVLEHIIDDSKAMREIYRVLKPDGWAILQVPMDKTLEVSFEDSTITTPKERKEVFGQIDHVRLYGRDYFSRLRKAGFKVTVENYCQNFSVKESFKYGFNAGDDIIIGLK